MSNSSGNPLLLRFFQSAHFTSQLCVAYLHRYHADIGIQHYLCFKLRSFPYEEIEYFLPELIHLNITKVTEAVALENLILEMCQRSTQFALMSFWIYQCYMVDESRVPSSPAFSTCKTMFNRVQHIVFGTTEFSEKGKEKIRENVFPATVLASLVMASVAGPMLPSLVGPIAIAQARKPPGITSDDLLMEDLSDGGGTSSPALPNNNNPASGLSSRSDTSLPNTDPSYARWPSSANSTAAATTTPARRSTSSTSMSQFDLSSRFDSLAGDYGRQAKPRSPVGLSSIPLAEQVRMLKGHYFRQEAQFLLALQDISVRLVLVPRPARLSALRAELALLNNDLPADVNIPGMTEAVEANHRVLRIDPSEASVLNSAERVPFLIMVEVLNGKLNFNPRRRRNKLKLQHILTGEEKRRRFDLSSIPTKLSNEDLMDLKELMPNKEAAPDPNAGDLSMSPMILGDNDDDADSDPDTGEDGMISAQQIRQSLTLSNGDVRNRARSIAGTSPYGQRASASSSRHSSGVHLHRGVSGAVGGGSNNNASSHSNGPNKSSSSISSFGPIGMGDDLDLSSLATHMRAAATMLAQLDSGGGKRPRAEVASIKAKIIAEMQSLEEQRLSHPHVSSSFMNIAPHLEENMIPPEGSSGAERKGDKEDPSAAIFEEMWEDKKSRIRRESPYGHLQDWDLLSCIVKTGADLRQEAFACQLIFTFKRIWEAADAPIWVRHMRILVTGDNSGLIETIANAISVHSIKKTLTKRFIETDPHRIATLKDHFLRKFGPEDSETYANAQAAFIRSLAGYSVICYLLQLKDRHNGNILIDHEGHVVHIDFGFLLSNTPGNVGFESAPFKLTSEYIDVIGDRFDEFREYMKAAFRTARKHAEDILVLVQVMGENSRLPCFLQGPQTLVQLRQRFQLHLNETGVNDFVDLLIHKSNCSVWTRLYDQYQMLSQGIY